MEPVNEIEPITTVKTVANNATKPTVGSTTTNQ